MVKLETRCIIPILRTFDRISCHVIREPPVTLQGAVTWRNQYDDRATLQGVIIPSAILKIVFHHIFLFLNTVWSLTSGSLRIVSDTLVLLRLTTDGHKASRGLSATAELLVWSRRSGDVTLIRLVPWLVWQNK